MVKATEVKNRSLKVKDVYLEDDNTIKNDDGNIVDIYDLIKKVFGHGSVFTVSVTSKDDTDILI